MARPDAIPETDTVPVPGPAASTAAAPLPRHDGTLPRPLLARARADHARGSGRRITSLPAGRAQLADRGVLRGRHSPIWWCSIRARSATAGRLLEPKPPSGIVHVFVNGEPVVEDGVYDPARRRRPSAAKGDLTGSFDRGVPVKRSPSSGVSRSSRRPSSRRRRRAWCQLRRTPPRRRRGRALPGRSRQATQKRPSASGGRTAPPLRDPLRSRAPTISVRMTPGAIALTRTPRSAHSIASTLVMLSTAAFAAQ